MFDEDQAVTKESFRVYKIGIEATLERHQFYMNGLEERLEARNLESKEIATFISELLQDLSTLVATEQEQKVILARVMGAVAEIAEMKGQMRPDKRSRWRGAR